MLVFKDQVGGMINLIKTSSHKACLTCGHSQDLLIKSMRLMMRMNRLTCHASARFHSDPCFAACAGAPVREAPRVPRGRRGHRGSRPMK